MNTPLAQPVSPEPEIESERVRTLKPARTMTERWRRFMDRDVRSHLRTGDDRLSRALGLVFPDGEVDRAEWWFAWTMVLWGGWLLGWWDTFSAAPGMYAEMVAVASEEAWGTLYFSAGMVYLASLVCERFGTSARLVWGGRAGRFASAFLATVLWWFVLAMLMDANWRSTGTVTYGQLLAGYSGWTLTRLVVHRGAVPPAW